VSQAAIEGDEIARDIIDYAAAKLADLARVTFGSLFRQNEPAIISYVGGVFESSLLTEIFKQEVTQTTGCEPATPLYPPAAGALLEAFRLTGRGLNISNLPGIKT
jgi:N-acetylglucosamine kinase-like BadF-type ATPase